MRMRKELCDVEKIGLGVGFKFEESLRFVVTMRLVVVENGCMGLKNLGQC